MESVLIIIGFLCLVILGKCCEAGVGGFLIGLVLVALLLGFFFIMFASRQ